MRIILQPAMILHRRPYRETSALVELFTRDYGRVPAIAKGIRRAKGGQGLFELFTPVLVSWYGRGELVTLMQVELHTPAMQLKGDCLFAGLYLNELLMRLLHKSDPHPELFTLYQETLTVLQFGPLTEASLRLFEKRLLENLGYNLAPNAELQKKIGVDKNYVFHPEHGFTPYEQEDARVSTEHIFSGQTVLAFAAEEWSDEYTLRDAKRLVRLMLAHLLGDRPLFSRQLFQKAK